MSDRTDAAGADERPTGDTVTTKPYPPAPRPPEVMIVEPAGAAERPEPPTNLLSVPTQSGPSQSVLGAQTAAADRAAGTPPAQPPSTGATGAVDADVAAAEAAAVPAAAGDDPDASAPPEPATVTMTWPEPVRVVPTEPAPTAPVADLESTEPVRSEPATTPIVVRAEPATAPIVVRAEPATALIVVRAEPATAPITAPPPAVPVDEDQPGPEPARAAEEPARFAEEPAPEPAPGVEDPHAPRTGSIWPGLTAAGLPTRVPLQADEETIKEAFAQSWEATPTGLTPLTRPPFTPTYLGEPPRPRASWADDLSPLFPVAAEPPEPREPPDPAEPPEPRQPPEPKEPPAPPRPEPGPSPFPSPTPVPIPPEPVPPVPVPPGPPIPTPPPSPPVPTPPAPFPPPPGPVPPPPAIVPGPANVYQGGNYSELATEPITGVTTLPAPSELASGTLTGHLLTRGAQLHRRRERRRRLRTVLWVTSALLVFGIGIAVVVTILAGDFIRSIFDTLSRWAG